MKKIKWRPVLETGGAYIVSNTGIVMSFKKPSGKGALQKTPHKIKHTIDHKGYVKVGVSREYYRNFLVHRLVAEAFIPNPKNKPCVNHINGNKQDNRVENLEWVTHKENTAHAHKNGLMKPPKGSCHHTTHLTEEDVVNIRRMRSENPKLKYRDIATKFNTSDIVIGKIVRRERWKHVK